MGTSFSHGQRFIMLLGFLILGAVYAATAEPIDIASRLEPMVDDALIAQMNGAVLQLHPPVWRDIAITFDAPWEGNTSTYVTVFQDDDRCRMYYRASNFDIATNTYSEERVCYAESQDGITWTKPELGLFEFNGSKANNILWQGVGIHNFSPFKDANPTCPPDARYKAVASGNDKARLIAFQSPDAIHWTQVQEDPIISEGAFDSQNVVFWDAFRSRYVEFHRGFRDGIRDIMTAASSDFLHWPAPEWLDYGDAPKEHLYTNAIIAYPRAPHIFIGFPKRFMPDRDLKVHPSPGMSDGVFMTSRDGLNWHRWREAFVRPGLQKSRWVNRNNLTTWGMLKTHSAIPDTPDEFSIYTTEGYYVGPCSLRRHTVRQDGFVSINAPGAGGEFTTKPLIFADDPAQKGAAETELLLNFSTSAAGAIRCEIQDESGQPIPGYALTDCDEIYGDTLERAVTWHGQSELKALAGKPVQLRFALSDADLYAIQFR